MIKKMFALASATALVGLVASVAGVGCSSSASDTPEEAGADASLDARKLKEAGLEDDAAPPSEEGTVGKECKADTDCKVPGTKNDNVCSPGKFAVGDIWGTPICIQPKCTQGNTGEIEDLYCDKGAGLCVPNDSSGTSGICLPRCAFDSTKVTSNCVGGNKCVLGYYLPAAEKTTGIGYCEAACLSNADCKGTPGQKCQLETATCKSEAELTTYAKPPGEGCTSNPTAPECFCISVGGTSANAKKGVCTKACITGAAGDALCAAAGTAADGGAGDGGAGTTGWTCTAALPVKDDKGVAAFTGQPADLSGVCALPCQNLSGDVACADLATATGTPMKCKQFAGGKWCDPSE